MTIDIDNLRIRFGDREVVKGVSFTVAAGGSFGIVGESGSGKSTVLRAMAGLNNDWSGRISFSGNDAPLFRPPAFFRKVQMVFQDPYGSLHPRQTIDRILSELPLVHGMDRIETGLPRCYQPWRCRRTPASAIRTSCPAASASAWPSPGP
jgi:peptide/nickel transport system ATP-binding protein